MPEMRGMDRRAGNAGADQDEGVCKFTPLPYRRETDWPFKFSVNDRGIVINKLPPAKKGAKQDLEALL